MEMKKKEGRSYKLSPNQLASSLPSFASIVAFALKRRRIEENNEIISPLKPGPG